MIRKATVRDVTKIHGLLKRHADRGDLLPRALSDLYDDVRDFNVVQRDEEGPLIAVCALHIFWEDLAEIRSLAVEPEYQHQGVGASLVKEALSEARDMGVGRIFTLTYRPLFFEKQGFKVIDKGALPQKIWSDCLRCVKFPDCDEVALSITLDPEP